MGGVKRLLLASTTLLVGGLILYALGVAVIGTVDAFNRPSADARNLAASEKLFAEGKQIFRFDTFGDEAFWGDQLRLHETVRTLSPRQALGLGLKVDVDALPRDLVKALRRGEVNLDDPAVTVALLKLDAVLGVKGFFDDGTLSSIGLTCAVCHSTADDSLAPGIGHRLDGWANQDLDVGRIVTSAPNLTPLTNLLQVSEATLKSILQSWGPGYYDAIINHDGKVGPPPHLGAVRIPPAFGLAGHNLHTWGAGWGTVSYWNAYVANTQMMGIGNFYDPRLNDPAKYPVAARSGRWNIRCGKPVGNVVRALCGPGEEDRVTSKLAALHFYQLALPAPKPPKGSFNRGAAKRGERIFNGEGKCASCHMPPLFTDAGWNAHRGEEMCIDNFHANRAPGNAYVTAPLAGLFAKSKRGFYHDGRFQNLEAVVDHYNSCFGLALTAREQGDLVEYLKSQ
jgi:mono/diheme cytochrome c family protein